MIKLVTCDYNGQNYIAIDTSAIGLSSHLWKFSGSWLNTINSQTPILVARASCSNITDFKIYHSLGNQIIIGSTGNVGIGTTAPRGVFDVYTNGDIYLANSPITGTAQSIYLPGHIYIAPYNGTNISYLQARRSDNSGSTELQIRTYNAGSLVEAMRINSSGNVGIGTTSPTGKLDVRGTSDWPTPTIFVGGI